jgi:disulfide bond formation protein DsbB
MPARTSIIANGAIFILLTSFAVLMTAYGFQFIGKLEPCEMCYWQRYPYYAAIPLSALAMFLGARKPNSTVALLLIGICAIAFFSGAAIAGYHSGVEYGWWKGPASCTAGNLLDLTAEALLEVLRNTNIVRCDEIPWSLFGISMAGYNFFASVFLGFVSLGIVMKVQK